MDPRPLRILGIAGSLRRASFNRGLIRAAVEVAPSGIAITAHDLRDLPMFDADVEEVGDPEPVAAFKRAIADADALLIATPEYNHCIPGVLKNAIDWASRPPRSSVLSGRPVAILVPARGVAARHVHRPSSGTGSRSPTAWCCRCRSSWCRSLTTSSMSGAPPRRGDPGGDPGPAGRARSVDAPPVPGGATGQLGSPAGGCPTRYPRCRSLGGRSRRPGQARHPGPRWCSRPRSPGPVHADAETGPRPRC